MFNLLNKLFNKEENKKEALKEKRKENFKKMIKENKKKGKDYEIFIGKKFEKKGYIVKFNGIEKGKRDNSIDLIAIKDKNIVFIQCKNWKENSKYKISHEKIKAFIGDTYSFIEKNPTYKNYKIERFFCVANDVFDKSGKKYLEENKNIIKYNIIPFKK